MEALGVKEVDWKAWLKMLRDAGPPTSLDIRDEGKVRLFLEFVMERAKELSINYLYDESRQLIAAREELKRCRIFPLHDGKKSYWGALSDQVMWLNTDRPNDRSAAGAIIVDPRFTFTPHERNSKYKDVEPIRDFNQRFCGFLKECGIDQYDAVGRLRRTGDPTSERSRQ